MDVVNQLLAIVRDTWEGVMWPIIVAIWEVAHDGVEGVLIALVIVGIIVFAYQEARR